MLLSKSIVSIPFRFTNLIRLCSTASNQGFTYIPKFSSNEQQKILDIINQSNFEELSRYNVSQARVKSLEHWRAKKGPFRALSDILEVQGLGVKVLERLCESIITNKSETNQVKFANHNGKSKKMLVTPFLPHNAAFVISTVVGLHLDPTGISWAKITCDANKLDTWNYYNFSDLPKKMLPNDTFDLALNILQHLPAADVYIFEAPLNLSPQQQNQTIAVSYNNQMELMSMLLALLNTSEVHNPAFVKTKDSVESRCENKVYFLRAKVPARLFKTLLGNEKVSATSIISKIVDNIPDEHNLPCTPVTVAKELKTAYYTISSAQRELMGQSLLLVISFLDLCIYRNPISLKAIAPGNRQRS